MWSSCLNVMSSAHTSLSIVRHDGPTATHPQGKATGQANGSAEAKIGHNRPIQLHNAAREVIKGLRLLSLLLEEGSSRSHSSGRVQQSKPKRMEASARSLAFILFCACNRPIPLQLTFTSHEMPSGILEAPIDTS